MTSTWLVVICGNADPYFGVVIDGCEASSRIEAQDILRDSLGARNAKLVEVQ